MLTGEARGDDERREEQHPAAAQQPQHLRQLLAHAALRSGAWLISFRAGLIPATSRMDSTMNAS